MSVGVPNQSRHLLPLLLPLVTVDRHVVQLQEASLHGMLSAVPLVAHSLHYRQNINL